MTIPDRRLTHFSRWWSNLPRSAWTSPLSIAHHSMDPVNTPSTKNKADVLASPVAPSPSPAKTAVKDKMVIGLVIVSTKVDA